MLLGVYNMPTFALKNKQEVATSTLAGCFHCCNIFRPEQVIEFTDNGQTCICPLCGVDAVVGDMGIPDEITLDKLKKTKFYWFNTKAQSSPT
jgi:NAD-dependent SIR2 family protein deacetylase